jgi:hypothetical protein
MPASLGWHPEPTGVAAMARYFFHIREGSTDRREPAPILVREDHHLGSQSPPCLTASPMLAALPRKVIEPLTWASDTDRMTKAEEYRQYAEECRRMAENAMSPDDKTAWLKLADAWLQMLPRNDQQLGWPKTSDDDLTASH